MPEVNNEMVTASLDDIRSIVEQVVETRIPARINRSHLTSLMPPSKQENATTAKVKKTFDFFRALMRNDHQKLEAITATYAPEYVAVLNPQDSTNATDGGYLVPPEFWGDVLLGLNEYGFARKHFNRVEMSSLTLNVSTLTAKPSATWYDENTAIAASKGTFGRLTLTAKKLAAIYPITNELLFTANIDVYNMIVRVFVEVFGQAEDAQAFRGTGTPFTSILNIAGTQTTYLGGASTSGKTAYTDIELDDLLNMINALTPAASRDAMFFLDQNTVTELLKRKDTSGRYLWDMTNSTWERNLANTAGLNGLGLKFAGYPVVVMPAGILIAAYDGDPHISTNFAMFGNPRYAGCMFGELAGFQVDLSNSAMSDEVNAFTNDLTLARLKEHVAVGIGRPADLAVLSTAAA